MNPNAVLATHVATELLLISGLSFYFHKKCKSQEQTIDELRNKLNEQDKKINNLFAQIQVIHKDIKTVADSVNNEPIASESQNIRRRRPQTSYASPDIDEEQVAMEMAQQMFARQQAQIQAQQAQIQQQRQKMSQQVPPSQPNSPNLTSVPPQMNDIQRQAPRQFEGRPDLQPTEIKQVRVVQMPTGGLPPIGMPMFPVNALFNMMAGMEPNQQGQQEFNSPVVVEEEDEGDISEELASLNQKTA